VTEEYRKLSRFEKAKAAIWGTPGFASKQSTVTSSGLAWQPDASYIVTTLTNDEGWAVLIEMVDDEGGQRLVLPNAVCKAIFRHYEGLMEHKRGLRAQRAADTRKVKPRSEAKDNEEEQS